MPAPPELAGPTAAVGPVRVAQPADAPALFRLSAAFAADGCLLPRAAHEFAERIGEFLVAVRDGELIGCTGLAELDDTLVVYNLCVAPHAQGGGIGRRLISAAAARGSRLGRHRLLAASKSSGHWFLRQGFEEVDPQRSPAAWAALIPPGRGSRLYCRGLSAPAASQQLSATHPRS
ncbi:GNAT family N-acetyltransferase [Kitasatospora sp. NPDC004669]|uniref:GNAT family N-acetyltransferase n=1 Tax=Kitasatospora sp. NPDC004669 TaxID=3154555 RepID=UPI0033A27E6F